DELHLGEISLECSRAGASAAALWLTFQLLPPTPEGLGQVLAACRRAAQGWSALLAGSDRLRLYQSPELDIVTYFPVSAGDGGQVSMSAIDEASARVLHEGMPEGPSQTFVSTLTVTADALAQRHPDV